MSTRTTARFLSATVLTALVALAVLGPAPFGAVAASHREAPLIAFDPQADNTDVYAFVSPDRPDSVTLIGNWIPMQLPYGGPNFYYFGDDVAYEIKIDNVGDAKNHITYRFEFDTITRNPETFLYNTGPINSLDDPDWNIYQTYKLTEIVQGKKLADTTYTVLAEGLMTAPVNIGSKSTPNYPALAAMAVCTLSVGEPGGQVSGRACNTEGAALPAGSNDIKVFAGPRDDPFFVDFSVFDLLTLRGQGPPAGYGEGPNNPIDGLAGFNVHTIALQIPISRLTGEHAVNADSDETDPVIGVWATSSRRAMDLPMRARDGSDVERRGPDQYVQISRLGMPLVNEVVIPLKLKDTFNSLRPSVDLDVYGNLQQYVEDPMLGNLLCGLYGVPLPGDTDSNCKTEFQAGSPRTGRADIFDIFLQGMVTAAPFTINTAGGQVTLPAGFNVNRPEGVRPAEMLRLNTAIAGDTCAPQPSRLGVLGGDACGFPNGRRLADDVVDIELLAVAGAAHAVLVEGSSFAFNADLIGVLTDRVDANDMAFGSIFPYVTTPHSGQSPTLPNVNAGSGG